MDEERRRPRKLTPLSGELKAPADWQPPGPVVETGGLLKPEKQLPTTRRGMILHGIKRFVLILGALCLLTSGVALLFVWLMDADPARAFPLTFYLGGAGVIAGGFLLSTEGSADWMPETGFDRAERESWIGSSVVYVALGIPLIVVGTVLDTYL